MASRGFAYLGGLMLVGLIVMTCASVVGRKANELLHAMQSAGILATPAQWLLDAGVGVVKGDYELIEAGIAFAIFAFMPLCQMTGGHASVDVFTNRLPARASRILQAVTEAVFAAVLVLIAVQLAAGTVSKLRTGQTTFLLQFPLWWAYALSLTGAMAAAVVGVYMACLRVAEAVQNRDIVKAET
jgi:TRAP-type C4-dicarboxylate transport system permease small subunit